VRQEEVRDAASIPGCLFSRRLRKMISRQRDQLQQKIALQLYSLCKNENALRNITLIAP
jgi:hypothetical protein